MIDFEEMLKCTEVTLVTKKAKKEIPVYCAWYDSKRHILCGSYTNRFGKYDVKQFDMRNYDIIL